MTVARRVSAGRYTYLELGLHDETPPGALEGVWMHAELYTLLALLVYEACAVADLKPIAGERIGSHGAGKHFIDAAKLAELRDHVNAYRGYREPADSELEHDDEGAGVWQDERSDHPPVPPTPRYLVERAPTGAFWDVIDQTADPETNGRPRLYARRRSEADAADIASRLNAGTTTARRPS